MLRCEIRESPHEAPWQTSADYLVIDILEMPGKLRLAPQ